MTAEQLLTDPRFTDKQRAFALEYAIDKSAAEAARRAGYSARTARSIGAENLTKPHIRAAVDALLAEKAQRAQITADDVLKGLHEEATFTGEGSSHSARVAAWAHLGKHLGMFTDKVENTHAFKGVLGIKVNMTKPDDD